MIRRPSSRRRAVLAALFAATAMFATSPAGPAQAQDGTDLAAAGPRLRLEDALNIADARAGFARLGFQNVERWDGFTYFAADPNLTIFGADSYMGRPDRCAVGSSRLADGQVRELTRAALSEVLGAEAPAANPQSPLAPDWVIPTDSGVLVIAIRPVSLRPRFSGPVAFTSHEDAP